LESIEDNRRYAAVAILASIVLHIMLACLVVKMAVQYTPPPHFISVEVVRLRSSVVKPVPKLMPKPVVKPKPVPKPVLLPKPVAVSRPVLHAVPQHHALEHSHVTRQIVALPKSAPPAMRFGSAGAQAGLGLDLGAPAGGSGRGSMDGFDDSVKARIEAAKTYPPGMPHTWNECAISYSVTIDRNGQMVDYKLWGCGDPFLDSAARAAIITAGPFAPPPDFGGSQYTVFGTLIFKGH
jgi:outer membrane biosynthesis protein TonB